jgi:hypothetical protein
MSISDEYLWEMIARANKAIMTQKIGFYDDAFMAQACLELLEAREKINKSKEFIKDNIILKPTDNWQWGYRSALLAIFDIVDPEESNLKTWPGVQNE